MPNDLVDASSIQRHGNDTRVSTEALLKELRNKHRLGIHVWEDDSYLTWWVPFPEKSYGFISKLRADNLSENMADENQKTPKVSLSLVPHSDAQIGVNFYGCDRGFSGEEAPINIAYLMNLDQSQVGAPKVIAASSQSLNTGGNEDITKKIVRWHSLRCGEFGDIYLEKLRSIGVDLTYMEDWQVTQMVLSATADDSEHTESQLDRLGQHYMGKRIASQQNKEAPYNEILTVVAPEHICAICVPVRESVPEGKQRFSQALSKYYGALAALEHEKQGMPELPVVLYHMEGERRGEIEYMCQGRSESLQAIKEAVNAMRESERYAPEVLKSRCNMTSIDRLLQRTDMVEQIGQKGI